MGRLPFGGRRLLKKKITSFITGAPVVGGGTGILQHTFNLEGPLHTERLNKLIVPEGRGFGPSNRFFKLWQLSMFTQIPEVPSAAVQELEVGGVGNRGYNGREVGRVRR